MVEFTYVTAEVTQGVPVPHCKLPSRVTGIYGNNFVAVGSRN
jgi:hypothetical protein